MAAVDDRTPALWESLGDGPARLLCHTGDAWRHDPECDCDDCRDDGGPDYPPEAETACEAAAELAEQES